MNLVIYVTIKKNARKYSSLFLIIRGEYTKNQYIQKVVVSLQFSALNDAERLQIIIVLHTHSFLKSYYTYFRRVPEKNLWED